jgi:hypothetical protein
MLCSLRPWCGFVLRALEARKAINPKAFDSPEISLLDGEIAVQEAQQQAYGDSAFADIHHLHRLIDLLNQVGRWSISRSFTSVLRAAMQG